MAKSGLAYQIFGNSGTPVVLIMGLGMRGSAWDNQTHVLSQKHRILIFDHLGLGNSNSLTKRGKSMSEMAEDVCYLLDEVGWQSAHIVGVSMGGMIAQHFALQNPQRARSLALLATSAGGFLAPKPTIPSLKFFLSMVKSSTTQKRIQHLEELLFPKNYLQTLTEEQQHYLVQTYKYKAPATTIVSHIKAVIFHNTKAQLHRLEFPVLILRPDQDDLIRPVESDILHRFIQHARLVSFKNAGHGFIRQCATEVNKELILHFADSDCSPNLT